MTPRKLWHYTTRQCFEGIAWDGLIRPATAGVPEGEIPAVWFSLNQIWEPTATKGVVTDGVRRSATMKEMIAAGGGLVRIGVDPAVAPHTWVRFRHLSGIAPSHAKALLAAAKAVGANPDDWRASFESVPSVNWLAIEELMNGHWVRLGCVKGGLVHVGR